MGFVFGSDNNNGPDSLTGPSLDNLMDNIPKLRLPEQFGPPEPQPEVYGPSQPEQFGPPQPPLATQPLSSSSSTIYGLINDAAQPNALNKYLNYTYHFRLFVMGDGDSNAAAVNTNISRDVGASLAGKPQVTIAESGVTGYNIKEVVIQTRPAGNDFSRQQKAMGMTITVSEPNGISFLDAIAESRNTLNLRNYTKADYYLELTFLGYDAQGQFKSFTSDDNMPNGGKWLWSIWLDKVTVNLTEAGAVYTILAQTKEDAMWTDGTDILNAPMPKDAKGDTLGAFLDSYIDGLNKAWEARYHNKLVIFDKVVTAPIGAFLAQPARVAQMDPRNFKMKATDADGNTNQNWGMSGNVYTANITSGYSVTEFIIDAIKHTEEGQKLAIDNPVPNQPDQSAQAVNERRFRESILWNVETTVRYPNWDSTTRNYQKQITFYLTPRYARGGAISDTELDDAADPQVQTGMIRSLVSNGIMRKRYDYVFTGLNTEVIDFKLGWKMTFSAIIPDYGGGALRYAAFRIPPRLRPDNTIIDGGASNVTAQERSQLIGGSPPSTATVSPSAGNLAVNQGTAGVEDGLQQTIQKVQNFRRAPERESTTANIYIEDELANVINAKELTVPVSFWQGNLDVLNETSESHFVGDRTRNTSIAGAVWAQAGGSLAKEKDFQNATMTIRGDPFWIGVSNLQRTIALETKNLKVSDATVATPDNCQRVFVYFRYPLMTTQDFKPAMKTSQTFNGIYQVQETTHTFSEGAFKTELKMVKDMLVDPNLWTGDPNKTNGGEGSPPLSSITPRAGSGAITLAPGASPQPGVDYTPGDPVSFTKAFLPLAQQISAQTGLAPETILGQAGLESGWGKSTPGNNFFGIKGTGGTYQTTEFVNGQAQTVNASLAGYQTSADSFAGFGNLMLTNRYSRVASAGDYPAQIQAIKAAGYATDPAYVPKVTAAADKVHGIISTL
jgi:hypothetical protein